jgi:hypothetical protein
VPLKATGCGQHLLAAINDIPDRLKIEADKYVLSLKPLPLSVLIGSC